jgi:hypothetical protein
MAFRVDVIEDQVIEVMRSRENRKPKRYYFGALDSAVSAIRFLIKKDLAKAKAEKFEPEIIREGRKAFKTLEEKSPYGKKR